MRGVEQGGFASMEYAHLGIAAPPPNPTGKESSYGSMPCMYLQCMPRVCCSLGAGYGMAPVSSFNGFAYRHASAAVRVKQRAAGAYAAQRSGGHGEQQAVTGNGIVINNTRCCTSEYVRHGRCQSGQ